MGGFCCCPCGEDFEGYTHPRNPIYRHCMCLRYFLHQLFSGYGPTFQSIEGRTSASPVLVATPLTSTATVITSDDDFLSDAYHLVPTSPPFDTSYTRYSHSQHNGLISMPDKTMSDILDTQLIRRSGGSSDVEQLGSGKKCKNADFEEESKVSRSEMERVLSAKAYSIGYVLTNLEDEDVCPICLEEYYSENPKIETKCSHYFHLSCMYEWMERSDSCPICGKEMEFCESH